MAEDAVGSGFASSTLGKGQDLPNSLGAEAILHKGQAVELTLAMTTSNWKLCFCNCGSFTKMSSVLRLPQ